MFGCDQIQSELDASRKATKEHERALQEASADFEKKLAEAYEKIAALELEMAEQETAYKETEEDLRRR